MIINFFLVCSVDNCIAARLDHIERFDEARLDRIERLIKATDVAAGVAALAATSVDHARRRAVNVFIIIINDDDDDDSCVVSGAVGV